MGQSTNRGPGRAGREAIRRPQGATRVRRRYAPGWAGGPLAGSHWALPNEDDACRGKCDDEPQKAAE